MSSSVMKIICRDPEETYQNWCERRAKEKGITIHQLRENDLEAVARADLTKWPYLTEQQVLDAHAQFGQLDKVKVKEGMGPNWPEHWDNIEPGDGIFSPPHS